MNPAPPYHNDAYHNVFVCPALLLRVQHMLPDGSLDEPTLRHFGNADGEVHIMKPVLLAHFMDLPQ